MSYQFFKLYMNIYYMVNWRFWKKSKSETSSLNTPLLEAEQEAEQEAERRKQNKKHNKKQKEKKQKEEKQK